MCALPFGHHEGLEDAVHVAGVADVDEPHVVLQLVVGVAGDVVRLPHGELLQRVPVRLDVRVQALRLHTHSYIHSLNIIKRHMSSACVVIYMISLTSVSNYWNRLRYQPFEISTICNNIVFQFSIFALPVNTLLKRVQPLIITKEAYDFGESRLQGGFLVQQ